MDSIAEMSWKEKVRFFESILKEIPQTHIKGFCKEQRQRRDRSRRAYIVSLALVMLFAGLALAGLGATVVAIRDQDVAKFFVFGMVTLIMSGLLVLVLKTPDCNVFACAKDMDMDVKNYLDTLFCIAGHLQAIDFSCSFETHKGGLSPFFFSTDILMTGLHDLKEDVKKEKQVVDHLRSLGNCNYRELKAALEKLISKVTAMEKANQAIRVLNIDLPTTPPPFVDDELVVVEEKRR